MDIRDLLNRQKVALEVSQLGSLDVSSMLARIAKGGMDLSQGPQMMELIEATFDQIMKQIDGILARNQSEDYAILGGLSAHVFDVLRNPAHPEYKKLLGQPRMFAAA